MTGNIGYKTIKRTMKIHTDHPLTDDAIKEMIQNIDSLIKEGTTLAEFLLNEENRLRKVQGLRENKRLSKRYINLAFQELINRDQMRGV